MRLRAGSDEAQEEEPPDPRQRRRPVSASTARSGVLDEQRSRRPRVATRRSRKRPSCSTVPCTRPGTPGRNVTAEPLLGVNPIERSACERRTLSYSGRKSSGAGVSGRVGARREGRTAHDRARRGSANRAQPLTRSHPGQPDHAATSATVAGRTRRGSAAPGARGREWRRAGGRARLDGRERAWPLRCHTPRGGTCTSDRRRRQA